MNAHRHSVHRKAPVNSTQHIHEEHNKKAPSEAASRLHHENEGQVPSAHQHQGRGEHHQHHDHHAHMVADFRRRFWVSLVLTLPILVLSPTPQSLLGLREGIRFSGDLYVLFAFSSAVFFYGGWPLLNGLFGELKSRKPGMMTLTSGS
jgi:P-type Cu2+ transporter